MSQKFYKLSQDIAARKDLLPSDKIVLTIITDYKRDNEYCWPGIKTIMNRTGLSKQTVLDSIKRLESSGDLVVIRRGKGKSNHYKTSPDIRPVEKSNRSKNQTTGGPEIRPEVVKKLDPNKTDTLNKTTEYTSFSFVLRNKELWYLPQEKLNEYTEAFPKLDVESELRKAAQWLIDNPGRRKTAKGMTRFLGGWLGRAEPKPEPKRGDLDWLPTEEEAEEIERMAGVVG